MAQPPNSLLQQFLNSRFLVGKEIPATGEQLAKPLAAALDSLTDGPSRPRRPVEVTITNPPNVGLIEADISGYRVSASSNTAKAAKQAVGTGGGGDRLPAEIEKVMLKAHPLVIEDIPVEADIQLRRVPINWVTDSGEVWLAGAPDTGDMSGAFAGSITKASLRQGVRKGADEWAQKNGLRLLDLDFDITQTGEDYTIAGQAKMRKGILSATAEARVLASYDPKRFLFRIVKVDVHSANPAVAMLLRMAQGDISKYEGKLFDLNDLLSGSGLQLTEAELEVSRQDVRIHGKFE